MTKHCITPAPMSATGSESSESQVQHVDALVREYAEFFTLVSGAGKTFREDVAKCGILDAPSSIISESASDVISEDITAALLAPIDELDRVCREARSQFFKAASMAKTLAELLEAHHA